MSKQSNFSFLKQKITLSYIILVVIAAVAIFVLYNGVQNILSTDRDDTVPSQKLYLTDRLLTLIYDAEADARSYYLFRRKNDLDSYVLKLDDIKALIDTSFILCRDNFGQIKSLQKIRELLMEQQGVVNKLVAIDRNNEQSLNYQRALDEIYVQAYEIIPPTRVIRQNTIIRLDSVYREPAKNNLFGKIKNLFSGSGDKTGKESPKVTEEQVTTFDTIVQDQPLPDSLLKIMKASLDNLKMRDNYVHSKVISKETELLHSDRIILDKIREMAASLETEELALSTENIDLSRSIIRKTIVSVAWLAALSFILILFFIFLIFRDIGKNKRYNLVLQSAKMHSEELVQAKEQFLAMMSHEIRTPLSSIIGFSEQLDKTGLTGQQGQYLDRIKKSSDFLLNLVNDILDLSKMNAGKLVLEKVRFNLAEVIQDVYQSFVYSAQAKSIEYICECDPALDTDVLGDPLRFKQVLINLAGNAIKFTQKGKVTIIANSVCDEKDRLQVRVSVSDTGVGIPTEKKAHIFEEFAQADKGVSRKYGGTGLGLAIANKIITISGGSITVLSAPQEGSTFIVELDFSKPSDTIPELIMVDKILPVNLLQNKHILVADDDETMLLLISTMLTNQGAVADTAVSGVNALSKLSANEYDLVLTDLNMPEMNGIELMENITVLNHQLPVLAITANSQVGEQYKNSGFAGFLTKPFKEGDLYKKIVHILFPEVETTSSGISPSQSADIKEQPISHSPYSLDEIIAFVGNEPETIQTIVYSFVTNSLATILEMRELIPAGNLEDIAGKAHKLIPLFRQFHLFEVVKNLQKLECYREINLSDTDFADIAKLAADESEEVIRIIASDWGIIPDKT